MMMTDTRILIVDDDPIVAESLAEFLRAEGYDCATAGDGNEAIDMIDAASNAVRQAGGGGKVAQPFGVVISDVNMPRRDGMALLKQLRKKHPSIVVLMVTGFGKIESAVEAVKLGAADYLTKPIVDDELRLAVNKALQQQALLSENESLKHQLTERFGLDNIVGCDYRMQKIFDLVEAVAQSPTTVLVEGESGTGKSMVARAIHERSPRRSGPFVTFACGSIPETLLESELFGHVKGAFTGADRDKPGKILAAAGGTLFIDEINSATPALQLKLLRVLQEKKFEPIGSTETISVDVRFILATNQKLAELVQSGDFREDLFYRINVVNIKMPPLRERDGDVPLLAEHFLNEYCLSMQKDRRIGDDALEAMRCYPWPGNVRELENAIERAVVLSRGPVISLDDLPDTVRAGVGHLPVRAFGEYSGGPMSPDDSGIMHVPALDGGWNPMPLNKALEEPEKQIILAALSANEWNRQQTARDLDINRTTLYKKMKQYRIDEPAA